LVVAGSTVSVTWVVPAGPDRGLAWAHDGRPDSVHGPGDVTVNVAGPPAAGRGDVVSVGETDSGRGVVVGLAEAVGGDVGRGEVVGGAGLDDGVCVGGVELDGVGVLAEGVWLDGVALGEGLAVVTPRFRTST